MFDVFNVSFFYMLFDCGIFVMHLLKYVILNDCALIVLEDLEDSERVFFVFCMFFFSFSSVVFMFVYFYQFTVDPRFDSDLNRR